MLGGKHQDQGHILENIVYLKLIRRGNSVYVGSVQDGEVDFVATNGTNVEYYQVSATVLDASTLNRELSSLEKVTDHNQKFLLTFDEIGANTNNNGIKQLNVLDWLIGNQYLSFSRR